MVTHPGQTTPGCSPSRWSNFRWRQTSASESYQAELKLLNRCKARIEILNTQIGVCKQNYLHSIVSGPEGAPPLVCLPGYGAGAGFYYRNLDNLSRNFRTYAVDWLGTGLSGRPAFNVKNRLEAEDFFTDSLAAWREKIGLNKMILMGHSLGGYLAATYALKHPEHVEHLILVCPAAIAGKPSESSLPERIRSPWTWEGQMWRAFKFMWNAGITPQSIIRFLGPWGHDMVGKYVKGRFTGLIREEEEALDLQSYIYHITAAKGSGEYALRHILAPFAWAHHPLEHRLADIKVPVTFIYGEHDWMDPGAAERAMKLLREKHGGPRASCDQQIVSIPDAGHYVFMDQPEEFDQEVVRVCSDYLGGDGNGIGPTGIALHDSENSSKHCAKRQNVEAAV